MSDTESSTKFLSALASFSTSLSKSSLAIYSVSYNMEVFGSWTVELGKRHQRSLLHWDGKEFVLSVSQCEVSDSRSSKDWKLVADKQIDSRTPDEEIFRIAENLVLENARS